VLVLLGATYLYFRPSGPSAPPPFRDEMVSYALRVYQMQLATNNLDAVRAFFVAENGITNYVLPAGLQQNATTTGCVTLTWHGHPVSMICFRSNQPQLPNEANDVWFFASEEAAAPETPTATSPQIATVNHVATATWTAGGRTYVLVAKGDETFLRRFL
jgi:hypothetical protein